MNGIAERRNLTLQDMVRSMMAETSLHIRLWGEALKTAIYLLNRVPTKATIKTSYELWTGRKPSLKNLHIWGCSAQLVAILLDIQKNRGVSSFAILALEVSLKL